MSIEKGMTAKVEDWMAGLLKALTYNDTLVFKTAEPWNYQLESLSESIGRYEPFVFVGFSPSSPQREGDYELCQNLRFELIFGVASKEKGVARRGDASHLGASKIRDLIITAINGKHPGDGFDCDNFYFSGDIEYFESPKQYAAGLQFEAKWFSE